MLILSQDAINSVSALLVELAKHWTEENSDLD